MFGNNSLLLLTLNVPFQIGTYTPRGTCTPGWDSGLECTARPISSVERVA